MISYWALMNMEMHEGHHQILLEAIGKDKCMQQSQEVILLTKHQNVNHGSHLWIFVRSSIFKPWMQKSSKINNEERNQLVKHDDTLMQRKMMLLTCRVVSSKQHRKLDDQICARYPRSKNQERFHSVKVKADFCYFLQKTLSLLLQRLSWAMYSH